MTILNWAATRYLPPILLPGGYQGTPVNYIAPLVSGIFLGCMVPATVPVFMGWFWFPQGAKKLARKLTERLDYRSLEPHPVDPGTQVKIRLMDSHILTI